MDNVFAFFAGILVGAAFFDSFIESIATRLKEHPVPRKIGAYLGLVRVWLEDKFVIVALSLMIVTVGLSGWSRYEDKRQTVKLEEQSDCSRRFANRLYDSLTPRQEVSEQLQEAYRELRLKDSKLTDATVALVAKGDDEKDFIKFNQRLAEKQVALAEVEDKEQELVDKRKANPYPDPPKVACPQ